MKAMQNIIKVTHTDAWLNVYISKPMHKATKNIHHSQQCCFLANQITLLTDTGLSVKCRILLDWCLKSGLQIKKKQPNPLVEFYWVLGFTGFLQIFYRTSNVGSPSNGFYLLFFLGYQHNFALHSINPIIMSVTVLQGYKSQLFGRNLLTAQSQVLSLWSTCDSLVSHGATSMYVDWLQLLWDLVKCVIKAQHVVQSSHFAILSS